MKCPSCNATIPSDSDICPACFAQIQTAQEPLTPPCTSAPVANPREVENQSEASSRAHEGNRQAPPSENATGGNSEGHFSRASSKKSLFLVTGILAVIAGILAGYVVLGNRQAPVPPPPVAKEQPAPEKPAEQAPETQAPGAEAPEKPTEAKPAQAPSPPVQKKTVKKVPKASPAPAPAPERKAWTYRPDPQPKPAPKPQAQRNGIGAWLDRTLGPEKPVTQPSNDPRYTGQ